MCASPHGLPLSLKLQYSSPNGDGVERRRSRPLERLGSPQYHGLQPTSHHLHRPPPVNSSNHNTTAKCREGQKCLRLEGARREPISTTERRLLPPSAPCSRPAGSLRATPQAACTSRESSTSERQFLRLQNIGTCITNCVVDRGLAKPASRMLQVVLCQLLQRLAMEF